VLRQVSGFKLSSLEHLSALKSFDGKTTLAQLMVQQVGAKHHACCIRVSCLSSLSVTRSQLGAQTRASLLDDLSQCTPASLIDVNHLVETSLSWAARLEHAVV
jgi:hypothetical protein